MLKKLYLQEICENSKIHCSKSACQVTVHRVAKKLRDAGLIKIGFIGAGYNVYEGPLEHLEILKQTARAVFEKEIIENEGKNFVDF